MANLVEIVIRAKDDTKAGFAEAVASGDSLGAKLTKIGAMGGLALAAIAAASVVMAAKFDSAMEMIHTQAGVAQNQLAGLKSGVLALAGQVGFSPDSLADALYHIESSFASVGIKGPQALNLLKIAAEGAAVGHADLVDVTNALDAAIASGIPGVQNFGQAMGTLNAIVGSGDMKMQDLADAFGTGLLATVKGFGVTLNDVGAALATFGDNNIRGAKAGTELRMAIQALGAPGTGPVAQAALAKLGVTYDQFAKDMQKGGLKLAIDDLGSHMHQMGYTGSKVGEILTQAFGKKAGSGINILISQQARFLSKYPDMTKGANGFASAWAATQATVAQKWKELEAGVDALGIKIGEALMPAVSAILGFLTNKLLPAIPKVFAALGKLVPVDKIKSDWKKVTDLFGGFFATPKIPTPPANFDLNAYGGSTPKPMSPFDRAVHKVSYIQDIKTFFTTPKAPPPPANFDLNAYGGTTPKAAPLLSPFTRDIKSLGDAIGKAITPAVKTLIGQVAATFKEMWGFIKALVPLIKDLKTPFEDLGKPLLVIVGLGLVGFFTGLGGILKILLGPLKGLTIAAAIALGLWKAWTIATVIFNAAMDMNPFIAIGVALVILVGLVIKYHTQIWAFIVKMWHDIAGFFVSIWNSILDFAKKWWPLLLGPAGLIVKYHEDIWKFIQSIWRTIFNFFKSIWGDIEGFFTSALSSVEGVFSRGWDSIETGARNAWNSVASTVRSIWGGIVSFFSGIPGKIRSAVGSAGSVLTAWGKGVINGLLSGMTSIIGSVWNFIKGIPGKILNFLGIHSPPQWAIDAGKHIMNGLGIGMSQAQAAGKNATSAFAENVATMGSGVARWRPLVVKALSMEGLSQQLVDPVLYQMQTESGGNPNAINLTDINAQQGDPSRGLMQTIMTTFQAYHWPGTSNNIYDPLANVAAAINYASHAYGPGLRTAYGGIGTGHGYGAGGATSAGWAMVGEHGRELMKVPGGATVYPHGATEGMAGGGLGPLSGGALVQLEVSAGGQSDFEKFMATWVKNYVRIKGGGNVQKTFGRS